jgi:hypothetical protein
VLFTHSGCHLEVDFLICFSSTRARLCEQHPVPSLGFGSFFYSLLLTRTKHRPVFPFLARSSCWPPIVLGFTPVIALLVPLFCYQELVRSAQPRPGHRVLLSSVSVTTAALRFDFFAAEAVRAGSFCRPDFSSVERLPSLGIARLPRILFFLRSGFHGEVFISKPPRLNFSL